MDKRVTIRLNKLQFQHLRHQAVAHHVTNSQIIRALIMTTNADNDFTDRKKLDQIHQSLTHIYSELLGRRFAWKVGLNDLDQANKSLKSLAEDHQKLPVQYIQNRLIILNNNLSDLLKLSKQEMNSLAHFETNELHQ